ncbi:LysR substrate-binding domain-containing protein [Ottowia testudinis]|uniref:LysR family transcriptional regulator n=1 Tax=Ottowia testudinis TaxID=2816950 RepID=A0A975H1M1_9BURK|nr:LysR substrate-binding domain-containing protein [Ottowia testudinis]QTD43894.1 LysR family transcriptional regulator [Ottowia testudinis]
MSSARYQAFVAVALHGNLSSAARALGLSQPTVSSQIQALERQSKLELFHRRGYRMHLSTAGEQFLPMAQKILALQSEAEFFLRDSGELNQGDMKIGAVGPFHVMDMVAAYRQRHPRMRLSIKVGNSKEVLADLERYSTDVAVLAGLHDSPGIDALPYARHPIILFAHRDHPLARHAQVSLAALHDVELLRREEGSTTQASLDAALKQAGVRTRSTLTVGSREAMREAVARGLGVGAVSEAEFTPNARLRPIRIEGDPADTATYIYLARERRDSPLLRSFLNAVGMADDGAATLQKR